jgi:hypothetical protein
VLRSKLATRKNERKEKIVAPIADFFMATSCFFGEEKS